MPGTVYVEGLREGAALREVTLTLKISNKGTVVSTDTCLLTVTPVLTDFVVTKAMGAAPDIVNAQFTGWELDSAAGGGLNNTFTEKASAHWQKVRGNLRFIQTAENANNIENGEAGADIGPGYKWDFAAPNAGQILVDSSAGAVPFYTAKENPAVGGPGQVTNSVQDSPVLPLTWVNSVLPAVGSTTNIDVTYNFVTYAVIAFNDNSIYCLGQQSWNIRYKGAVKQPAANNYTYAPAAGNADNGSGAFGAGVRNNANPAAIGPTFANNAGLGWR
ncbi:MAG TPA: hypothetical protein VH575_31675 [Gemmataceae bacterium]|jgi:hypothetical protein